MLQWENGVFLFLILLEGTSVMSKDYCYNSVDEIPDEDLLELFNVICGYDEYGNPIWLWKVKKKRQRQARVLAQKYVGKSLDRAPEWLIEMRKKEYEQMEEEKSPFGEDCNPERYWKEFEEKLEKVA